MPRIDRGEVSPGSEFLDSCFGNHLLLTCTTPGNSGERNPSATHVGAVTQLHMTPTSVLILPLPLQENEFDQWDSQVSAAFPDLKHSSQPCCQQRPPRDRIRDSPLTGKSVNGDETRQQRDKEGAKYRKSCVAASARRRMQNHSMPMILISAL